jgi:hypothetical protein
VVISRLLAITAGTLLVAPAADVFDLRVSVGLAPATQDSQVSYHDDNGNTASEGVEGLDIGMRLQLGMTKSIYDLSPQGQVLLVLNGIYSQQSGNEVAPSTVRLYPMTGPMRLGVMAVHLGVGYAHWLGESTHLELVPFLGYGTANIRDAGVSANDPTQRVSDDGHGQYREYGFTMGLYHMTGPSKIVLGIGFSYFRAHAEADPDFNLAGGGKLYEHVEINQVGVSPWLSLGMRF